MLLSIIMSHSFPVPVIPNDERNDIKYPKEGML